MCDKVDLNEAKMSVLLFKPTPDDMIWLAYGCSL